MVNLARSSSPGMERVTANITQSGVYILAGAVSTNLSGAIAYPVPFKPSAGTHRYYISRDWPRRGFYRQDLHHHG